jgi:hypothetical protein
MDAAGKLDPVRLAGRNIPTPMDVYGIYVRYGRLPLISPPR